MLNNQVSMELNNNRFTNLILLKEILKTSSLVTQKNNTFI